VTVLLLEAGGTDSNPNIHDPAQSWQLWMTENDWWPPTVPQTAAANRTLYIPRGKVLGVIELDQRHDLHPRQSHRLRPLGLSRKRRLGL
jgi:hypothetical protein